MFSQAQAWFLAAVVGAGLLRPVVAAAVLVLFLLLRGILARSVFGLASRIAARSRTRIDISFFLALENPLKNFILLLGLYIALSILPLAPPVARWITVLFRIAVVLFLAWALYNLVGSPPLGKISRRYRLDPLLLGFLVKAVKALIAALAVIMILHQLGYDINGFIAGLGLGGLAVALAAKDVLANIFAGIVIIADKPFAVGDWIATAEVEGTVEQVTFRSTRIRTFAQALVTVPNAVLANEAITNWSRMGKRRISFKLGVALNTPPDRLERSVRRIRELLRENPGVHPETILVHLEGFGERSLEIAFYFFTRSTAYAEYLEIKEAINLRIIGILREEEVSLALRAFTIPGK